MKKQKLIRPLGMILGVLLLSLTFLSCDLLPTEEVSEATATVKIYANNSFVFPYIVYPDGSELKYVIDVVEDDGNKGDFTFTAFDSFADVSKTVTYTWSNPVNVLTGASDITIWNLKINFIQGLLLRFDPDLVIPDGKGGYIKGGYVAEITRRHEQDIALNQNDAAKYQLDTIVSEVGGRANGLKNPDDLAQAVDEGKDIKFSYLIKRR